MQLKLSVAAAKYLVLDLINRSRTSEKDLYKLQCSFYNTISFTLNTPPVGFLMK